MRILGLKRAGLWMGLFFVASLIACGNDDGATDDDSESESETESELKGCEGIDWEDPEVYLVNGGTVSLWDQSVWMDSNDSGMLDKEERKDVDITFVDLCESGKQSLFLLIATDN